MNHHFQSKISLSTHKLISSLSTSTIITKSPQNPHISPTIFDPFQFFNHYSKLNHHTIKNTKTTHAHLLKITSLRSYVFLSNSLVDWYCKAGDMGSAARMFDQIPDPNVISWNILISGYNKNLSFDESWCVFCKMRKLGFEGNQFTYGSVFSACTLLKSVTFGKQVYSLALKNGFFSNGFVRTGMIDLFAKSFEFEDALKVFYDVGMCDNVVCWNAIIAGAVKNGEEFFAVDLFCEMCHGFFMPNRFTFSSALTACATLQELELGKMVQGWVIKCGAGDDIFVGAAIVDLYAKCGNMENAINQFTKMPIRNVVSWTSIISGFVQMDDSISALQLFNEMRNLGEEVNTFTATSILTACSKLGMFEAIQIHSWIMKYGLYSEPAVTSSLIKMYSKIGAVDFSYMVFRETNDLNNLGTWAAMISAFAQNERSNTASKLFIRLLNDGLKPDKFCSSSVLSVVDCLNLGRQIHTYTLKSGFNFDVSVGSSIFTMYSKCGSLEESYQVFEQMLDRDNVSWASMIAGFAEYGYANQAIELFRKMLLEKTRPDEMTLVAILTACSIIQSLEKGKEIHGYALRAGIGKETHIGGALVNLYSKSGSLDLGRMVFEMMPQKDPVSCSSLISGYAQHGFISEALSFFHQLSMDGWGVDSFTLSSILGVVALNNKSEIGTQLHAHVIKVGLDTEVSIGSSLVTAYSKSGNLDDCRKAFDKIEKPDLISWTTMIVSYAQHGKGPEALNFFRFMKESGIKPDDVTFVGVLSACSHTGLVDEGYFHLNSMKDYGITPSLRHYVCMVDVLGRSGRLKEAELFIQNMPIEPDGLVWGTLLAACKLHGDVELGRLASKKILEFGPCDVGAHVSMSNIYADVGQWEEVEKIRSLMKGTGAVKESAWSVV